MRGEIKSILSTILAAIMIVVTIIAFIYFVIGFGYLFGLIIVVLPFIGDWLTVGLPIVKSQIPGIMSWILLIGVIIGIRYNGADKDE